MFLSASGTQAMKTKCEVCDQKFSASEALCDNWKDPERAYGCPNCGTFYVKDLQPDWRIAAIGGCLGGGVGTPTIMLLSHGLRQSDDKVVLLSIAILLFGVIGMALAFSLSKQALVRSPYRSDSVSRAADVSAVSKLTT